MNIIWIIIIVFIFIHIAGWLIISSILHLYASGNMSIWDFVSLFFLWEVAIIILLLEECRAKIKKTLSNFRN